MNRSILRLAALLAAAFLMLAGITPAVAAPLRVTVATWRGCEEICTRFLDRLRAEGLAIDATILDARQNRDQLPDMVRTVKDSRPDLLVTWGTIVTLALAGPAGGADPARHITDIPTVYLHVADPVGAGIVAGDGSSGRANIAGGIGTVPYDLQVKAMQMYRPLRKLAILCVPAEENSMVMARRMTEAATASGVVVKWIPITDQPEIQYHLAESIIGAADWAPDFLMMTSSSLLFTNRHVIADLALRKRLALFATAEAMVEAGALLALKFDPDAVADLAARQAVRILRDKAQPGSLATPHLKRFALAVNLDSAERLGLYPPPNLLQITDFIGPAQVR